MQKYKIYFSIFIIDMLNIKTSILKKKTKPNNNLLLKTRETFSGKSRILTTISEIFQESTFRNYPNVVTDFFDKIKEKSSNLILYKIKRNPTASLLLIDTYNNRDMTYISLNEGDEDENEEGIVEGQKIKIDEHNPTQYSLIQASNLIATKNDLKDKLYKKEDDDNIYIYIDSSLFEQEFNNILKQNNIKITRTSDTIKFTSLRGGSLKKRNLKKNDPSDKILNPKTNRYVLKTGKIGQELLKQMKETKSKKETKND